MHNNPLYEEYFQEYMGDINKYLPEGIIEVDIHLLQKLALLTHKKLHNSTLTRYFHVLESLEKITLMNNQFVIWIVPDTTDKIPRTYVLIALNKKGVPKLETAFVTSDVYNSSKLVLRILEKFLQEIQENEEMLKLYEKTG